MTRAPRVVRVLLFEARVDDVDDVVDGQRRFGDVRRQNDFPSPGRRWLENLGLHVGRQVGVDGDDEKFLDLRAQLSCSLRQKFLAGLDLLLAPIL